MCLSSVAAQGCWIVPGSSIPKLNLIFSLNWKNRLLLKILKLYKAMNEI